MAARKVVELGFQPAWLGPEPALCTAWPAGSFWAHCCSPECCPGARVRVEHPDGSPFLPSGFPESQDFTLCQVCSPQSLPRWTRPLSDHCCHPRTVHTGPCSFPPRRGLPPQPQTLSPAPPALLGVQGSRGGEKAGVGKRLLDLAWPLGNAGQGACPCGVSHTAPLEAHPLKERGPHRCPSGSPGVRGGVGTPSCLHPWSWAGPFWVCFPPSLLFHQLQQKFWGCGGAGRKLVLVFSDFASPCFPLSPPPHFAGEWGGPGGWEELGRVSQPTRSGKQCPTPLPCAGDPDPPLPVWPGPAPGCCGGGGLGTRGCHLP